LLARRTSKRREAGAAAKAGEAGEKQDSNHRLGLVGSELDSGAGQLRSIVRAKAIFAPAIISMPKIGPAVIAFRTGAD
jgi:hypothetical protein